MPRSLTIPSVSIVVIAYNEEAGIGGTLASIARQKTFVPFEIVLDDDCSSDHTVTIARKAMEGESRFRVIELHANGGRGEARRVGVDDTQSDLVGFVDADIELPSNWLETCVAHLENADAVSGIAVPDGDAAVIARVAGATPRPARGSQPITGNNILFKRAVLDTVPFPTTRLGEDFRFSMRLKASGFRVAGIPDLRVVHREHKSFAQGLRWMAQSGVDANRLLAEFREVRLPDLTTFASVGAIAAAFSLGAAGFMWAGLVPVMLLLATSLGFAFQRFVPLPHFGRWLIGFFLSIPLLAVYLAARVVTLPILARIGETLGSKQR